MIIRQIRGNLRPKDMAIPSQDSYEEGVETRRRTPSLGEGIVQTTNPKGAAKVEVGCITDWSLVQVQVGPPSIYNKPPFF